MKASDLEEAMTGQLRLLRRQAGGRLPAWWPEYQFAPPRRWRFDYAWPDQHVALEVEGGTWQNGRHTRGAGFEKDCEKYNEAACLGWTVLRVTGSMVEDGSALRYVERALASH